MKNSEGKKSEGLVRDEKGHGRLVYRPTPPPILHTFPPIDTSLLD